MAAVFRDRHQAGQALAAALAHSGHGSVVVALPRGGVPVGFEIARELRLPLDIIGVRKIGAPHQPELAVGAIVQGQPPEVMLDESLCENLGLARRDLAPTIESERRELRRREEMYRSGHEPLDVMGRSVIVVDDGIATGATMLAVLDALRKRGASRVMVAAPVGSPQAVRLLWNVADEVVCLHAPAWFRSVGQFYEDFTPTKDEEVVQLLDQARSQRGARED